MDRMKVLFLDIDGVLNSLEVFAVMMEKEGWTGTMQGGHTPDGMVFVFIEDDGFNQIKREN